MTFLRITVYAREKEFYSDGDEYVVVTREKATEGLDGVMNEGMLSTMAAYLKLEEKVNGRKRREGKRKVQ